MCAVTAVHSQAFDPMSTGTRTNPRGPYVNMMSLPKTSPLYIAKLIPAIQE